MTNSENKEFFQLDIKKIHLTKFLKAITETKLFERLKNVQQLGLNLVFPKVNHSRYDHSIGTYHLADIMMNHLEENSKIEIPQLYRECVQVAALLHDIGHGPWSHFWEQNINKEVKHERNCEICIDKIFEDQLVRIYESDVFQENFPFAIKFIKSLITGKQLDSVERHDLIQFKFLYEIINNKHQDIDVDRWDYLHRDFNNAKNNCVNYPEFDKDSIVLDFQDIFTNATISEDRQHISYDESSVKTYNFFEARQKLHVQLYTHPITKLYENLLARAIKRADEINQNLEKFNGKLMNQVNFNSETFTIEEIFYLTDKYIFEQLKQSEDKEIKRLIDFIEQSRINSKLHDTIKNYEILVLDVKDYPESELKKTIKNLETKYDVKEYALIEIKVKSPTEKHGTFTGNIKSNNKKGIHKLHIFDVKQLLDQLLLR